MADFHRARRKPAPRRKHYAQGTGWLSAAGAYRPIGTPDLSLVMDLTNTGVAGGRAARGMGRNGAAGADGATGVDGGRWLPAVRHGTERVVDHNTRAFHQLRREIRRSSRAIPACKAGQELQEVMDNPLLHTQAVTTRIAAGGSRKPAGIGHSHQRSGGAAGQGGGVSTELSQSAGERKRHQAHRHRRQQPQQSEPPREMQRPELPVIVPPFALVAREDGPYPRLPTSFVEKTPRHANEDEDAPPAPTTAAQADDDGAEDGTYEDDFEDDADSDDSTVSELLDYIVAHGPRNDTQLRMGEHSRNWQLIESKANSELADKIETLREKRELRSHSKLRAVAVGAAAAKADGTGSSDRKARRHQAIWMAKKRRRREQHAFLRKHPLFGGLLQTIVERSYERMGGEEVSPRPQPSKLESLVLRKIKLCLLERAGLLDDYARRKSDSSRYAPGGAAGRRTAKEPSPVELPPTMAQEIFFEAASTLTMDAFAGPETLGAVALLRAALQIPDDAYRAWLTERSILHFFRPAPAISTFDEAPPMEPIDVKPRTQR